MPHTVEIDASTLNIKNAWAVKEVCEAADRYSVTSMGMDKWTMTLAYEHGVDNAAYDFNLLIDAIEKEGFTATHDHGMGNRIANYQTIDLLVTK